MSRIKSLIQILEACEKTEFDGIVKSYLREVYNYKRVVLTDGKDDTGIDIKVFDLNGQNIQYQMTTQKSQSSSERKQFEKKVIDDIKKANENASKYGYSPSLYFFYSRVLTNKAIRDFKRTASIDYGINLEVIEANQIAEESEEYLELQKAIYDTSGLKDFKLKESIFDNSEKNLIYDLVGFGKSADIKLQIVDAFILQSLFEQDGISKDKIISLCNERFVSKENPQFYNKLLSRLQSSKKITTDKETGNFTLSAEEKEKINKLYSTIQIDEEYFLSQIYSILKKYNQEGLLKEYVHHLKKIYSDNFNSNMSDGVSNENTDLYIVSRDLTNFIMSSLKNSENQECARSLAIELFEFCDKNKYLQKICASKVFGEQTNLARIENYVNQRKRVFIDTSLALYFLCYFFKQDCQYENYFYRISTYLLDFCRINKISLFIPEFYLWETQSHVRDAINLIPFTSLPNFQKLGKSRNVFYNFYLFLFEKSIFIENYESFLNRYGFKQYDKYTTHNELIEKYLNQLGINKLVLTCEYDIEDSKKMLQEQLSLDNKFKTKFGLNNDAIMLEFLGDNDVEIHPMDPLFITWDKTFFKVQNRYFAKRPTAQRWHLFTPEQMIDHYSLLNFKIDSEVVTKELIAILSDDIIQNTHSLLDSLTFLINPKNDVGLEYTNRLAEIRDHEIYNMRDYPIHHSEDFEGEFVIDDVFYKLTNHYKELEQQSIQLFQKVFTKKDYIEDVVGLINDAVTNYYQKSIKFNDEIIVNFDKLIERMVADEKNNLTL